MPTIVDNNFAHDSHAMRGERLLAINANFELIQPELASPAPIAILEERNHNPKN